MTRERPTLAGVRAFETTRYSDSRGSLLEMVSRRALDTTNLSFDVAQINVSESRSGVVRGLHYQSEHPQAKLVHVVKGRIFDVVVDLRANSETYGCWQSAELTRDNSLTLFIPIGFAHGYAALEDAIVVYALSELYDPLDGSGIVWNDPTLAIEWPIETPTVSERDQRLPLFSSIRPPSW